MPHSKLGNPETSELSIKKKDGFGNLIKDPEDMVTEAVHYFQNLLDES